VGDLAPDPAAPRALPPWRQPAAVALAERIAACFQHWTGRHLVPPDAPDRAAALYAHDRVLLAHALPGSPLAPPDASEPCFIYANAAAQALWGYDWTSIVGMPSRRSAPPAAQAERERMLSGALASGLIEDYQGVRQRRDGVLFSIRSVALWLLTDAQGGRVGQAASFVPPSGLPPLGP
jgi:hypothetical protein